MIHFGEQTTTECLPWDAGAEQVESALEMLDNVDSVRVDRTGTGVLSSGKACIRVDSPSFQFTGGITFVASSRDDLSSVLFVGDIIKLSAQTNAHAFYKIVLLTDETMIIDKPFVGAESNFYYATRYVGFRYTIYCDGHAMHMGNSDSS